MTGKGTKRQSFRCEDEIWLPFGEKAKREGTNASEKLRNFMLGDLAEDDIVPDQST